MNRTITSLTTGCNSDPWYDLLTTLILSTLLYLNYTETTLNGATFANL